MIFQQLEPDFALGQEAHKFQKFFRGNSSCAFFFYFGFARCADGELEIRGRQRDLVSGCLAKNIAKNWNRCFALDNSLRETELLEQVKFFYTEFHRWISSAGRRKHYYCCEGLLYPVLKYG